MQSGRPSQEPRTAGHPTHLVIMAMASLPVRAVSRQSASRFKFDVHGVRGWSESSAERDVIQPRALKQPSMARPAPPSSPLSFLSRTKRRTTSY